jgi:bifunctional enzyme CysN/CysC
MADWGAAAVLPAPEHAGPDLLRFLTCGSVDDGKSTLIGRLLYDLNLVPTDQLSALKAAAAERGAPIDLAHLLDGLEAEQEQGITIDVAYRYFSTPRRSFIVADAPGHEQYTRNMATGASASDAAILLIDARKGVITQTRRHSLIVSQFGVRHVVLAVNKMDLVDYSREAFQTIEEQYREFAKDFKFSSIIAIPTSATNGDNVARQSDRMPWYRGPTLIERLEMIEVGSGLEEAPFRMPVQWVCRPHADFRGLAGTVRGGAIRRGGPIAVAGAKQATKVARILRGSEEVEAASPGEAIMVVLADELDAGRGDVLCQPGSEPAFTDQVAATILWMSDAPMIPGRSYLMKVGARKVPVEITALKYSIDVNTGAHTAARVLGPNEIGFCNVAFATPVAIDAFSANRDTGSFILIDRFTNATIGAGMVAFELRRASNIYHQSLAVDQAARTSIKQHRPGLLWFTGLSGAGKSTIASLVEQKLNRLGCHTYLIDGDNIRGGLNRDLGFTEADRVENIRRVQEVSKLFLDAGLIVLVSLISPFRSERLHVRETMKKGEFFEIFVDAPIELCRTRDPKGLYAKAARGELKNFTGVDAPYEAPENPEMHLMTGEQGAEALAESVLKYLRSADILRHS